MHESSLILGLLKQISQLAKKENAKKITEVNIKLGALSNISSEHFREHFAVETGGSIADGAKLNIKVEENIHDPHALEIILESIEVE